MFSNNQKISIRQIQRLLILDLFGLGSLLLPGLLARCAGTDGVFCIFAALALGLVYVWVLGRVLAQMKEGYYSYMKNRVGVILSDILMVFYLFLFLLTASYVLYQLTTLIRAWLLPEGGYAWISFLLILLVAYATVRGLEGRARIYEILFWFLFVPLVLMLVLAARDVNVDYWTPVFFTSMGNFWQGTLLVSAFFLPVFFILFLKPYCGRPERLAGCAARSMIAAAGILIVLYLILLGNFGTKALAVLKRPVITLMSMVKLPGGFFARMDAFMTAIWFFSLFALMNTGVFYAGHILKELFRAKKTRYSLLAVLAGCYVIGQWFFGYGEAEKLFAVFVLKAALPALVALPVLLWLLGCLQEKRSGKAKKQKSAGRGKGAGHE